MNELKKYEEKEFFLDIPLLLKKDLLSTVFPDLLPDVETIRKIDYPLFEKLNRVYLDTTATSQDPLTVRKQFREYQDTHLRGSNHSKNSAEAREAQKMYEQSKARLKQFFNASNYLIGFTSATTDTSNCVAFHFPFKKGDLALITEMEHHSQMLTFREEAKKAKTKVKYVPLSLPQGRIDLEKLKDMVDGHKDGKILLNLVHVSNVSGVINPVKEIRQMLGDRVYIYLDMAQSAGHMPINLDDLDVDFAGISSHKMYGPEGVGAIFVNKRSERMMSTRRSGGSAVKLVSRLFTAYADAPARFEPGTQNIEGAIGLMYTLDYLDNIGMENIEKHDRTLGEYFIGELDKIKGVNVYGPKDFNQRVPVISFNIGHWLKKSYDNVARELDSRGISVRDGCFCAHTYTTQIMGIPKVIHEGRTLGVKCGISDEMLKLPGAVRASFAFYNNMTDAYKCVMAIKELAAGNKCFTQDRSRTD